MSDRSTLPLPYTAEERIVLSVYELHKANCRAAVVGFTSAGLQGSEQSREF